MNILIIGKGFIGSYLFKYFKENTAHNVNAISRADIDYFKGDLIGAYITGLFLTNQLEKLVIINCVGYTGKPNVDACESNIEECAKYNVHLPLLLEGVFKALPLDIKFIHVSSGCIYNGYDKVFSEEDNPNFGFNDRDSSVYSKSKHYAEMHLDKTFTGILRLRMPFCGYSDPRNLLNKILSYDSIISQNNSLTCVEDFAVFVERFIIKFQPGIYNVVNSGYITANEIRYLMQSEGINNPNWKEVKLADLNLKANRSNCILSTEKIEGLKIPLPDIRESLQTRIRQLAPYL